MKDIALILPYPIFMISTAIFLRRLGYAWLAACLAGFFGFVIYLLLFAGALLTLSYLLGRLRISEEVLPYDLFAQMVAAAITIAWCVGGFHFSKRPPEKSQPSPSNPETAK